MMPSRKAFGKGAVASVHQCLAGEFLHDGKGFGKLALPNKNPDLAQVSMPFGSTSAGMEEICFSAAARSPFDRIARYAFNPTVAERLRRYGGRAIKHLSAASKSRKAI